MSEAASVKFSCDGCGRSYAWKEQLAGKRVKCKCGHAMTVPDAAPEPEFDPDALYALAEESEQAAKAAPSQHRVVEERPKPAKVAAAPAATSGGIPSNRAALGLGYQRGPTAREIERTSLANTVDMKRDVYFPVGYLVTGFILYVGYYAVRYEMSGAGVAAVSFGLGLITLFKAALLYGFALAIAGPVGVSFGGYWSAALKLAATAVFCDGVTTLVDGLVIKLAGPFFAGPFGFSWVSFFVAAAVYWVLMIHLFDMDMSDSWFVVALLVAFDIVVRWVLVFLLLAAVLNWGGVSGAALPMAGGGGKALSSNKATLEFNELKESRSLVEAREFIKGGRQEAWMTTVDALYAAGCKNVYFATGRDFEGKVYPSAVVIEMPKDAPSRKKVIDALQAYYNSVNEPGEAQTVVDDNEPYMFMGLR